MPDIYGIKIVGYGDNPIMIDHHGIVQTWVDTVIENIDNGFPVIINFYLPAMVSYVRQMRLNLRFEHFRAYDKAAGNFGGTTTQNTTSHSHDISISLEAFGTGSMSGSTSRKVTSDMNKVVVGYGIPTATLTIITDMKQVIVIIIVILFLQKVLRCTNMIQDPTDTLSGRASGRTQH